MDYVQFIFGWEFSWFKMSEEVNSCEMHLVPLLVTTCHHMSHEDVNFSAKQCGNFNSIDWMTFWKLVNDLYFTCWDAEIPWIVVCLKIVIQEREINWMHLKPNDSENMRPGPSCRIVAVSIILARHLLTLVTLNFTRSWEDSHFGSESWWMHCTNSNHLNVPRAVGFNSCQCLFRTTVNQTFVLPNQN